MKGFLLSILVIAVTISASAQSASHFTAENISTVGSLDSVTRIIPVTAGYSSMGIQVVTTKVSGTVAGKAYLYGSIDGVNYTVTDSSSAFANQTTNVAFFTKSTFPYTFQKVQVRDAAGQFTTQVNTVNIYYVLRKYDQ